MWDVKCGTCLSIMAGHLGAVLSVQSSPSGSAVLTGDSVGHLRVWDTQTYECTLDFQAHTNKLHVASFSPDGSRIVTGSEDCTAKVWSAITGRLEATLEGHEGPVTCSAFSPCGNFVVTGSDDTTGSIWCATTGEELATLGCADGGGNTSNGHRHHQEPLTSAVFSLAGNVILTIADDGLAKLWSAENGHCLGTLPSHGLVRAATFSTDGMRVVTGHGDGYARIWETFPAEGSDRSVVEIKCSEHEMLQSVDFSPDGRLVLAVPYQDQEPSLCDAVAGRVLFNLTGHSCELSAGVFCCGGRAVATASLDHTVRVWDVATAECILKLEGHEEPVENVVELGS